jgi:hypothetical protein
MGNNNSKPNQSIQDSGQIIDYIATHYILTMDFQSLVKLYDKEYCNNLVVLTSNIIDKYFNPLEINYLAQRIKNGVEVNEMVKDKIIFFNQQNIDKLNLQNPLKKKRVCIGIAKFYIKIAHIFAAINMTINPVYIYKNANGEVIKTPLYNKAEIPPNVPKQIIKLNICDDRIKSLNRGQEEMDQLNKNLSSSNNAKINKTEINIHPNICDFNIDHETLMNEPGIPELVELYYDDNFDYNTGKFLQMSEQSRKDYEKDLLIFYNVFSGNNATILPSNIKSFNDIKLKNYHNTADCQGSNVLLNQDFKGSASNKLFYQYAENIKKMVKNANDNQKALLTIINKLFVYTFLDNELNQNQNQNQKKDKQIRINPKLTEETLQEIVVEARNLIMKLYLTCEIDYTNGIKIYEAIIEDKILQTSQNQIKYFNKITDDLREK